MLINREQLSTGSLCQIGILAAQAQGGYKWLYDWNWFMQNKFCYTGQMNR